MLKQFFQKPQGQFEFKFHMKTPKVKRSKFITNINDHMTKMAVMPI